MLLPFEGIYVQVIHVNVQGAGLVIKVGREVSLGQEGMRLAAGIGVRAIHAGQVGIIVIAAVVVATEKERSIATTAHCGCVEVVVVVMVKVGRTADGGPVSEGHIQGQGDGGGRGGAIGRRCGRGLWDGGQEDGGAGRWG